MGGAIFRTVEDEESSREGGSGRRSGELPPWRMLPRGARAGIFEGLFIPGAVDMTELASGFRDMLAPKLHVLAPKVLEDTGVLARLGGGPRMVAGRLTGVGLGAVAGLVGMPVFDGVLARGGGAEAAAACNSSR